MDFSEFEEFANDIQNNIGKFKEKLPLFLEGAGLEFLNDLQDEVIRKQVVDTRLLLNSIDPTKPNAKGSVNRKLKGGLEREVGTNVEYAAAVNDGHWTTKSGVKQRFVPGKWVNGKFKYDKNAKTGMVLKRKFIKGRHFWESAMMINERKLQVAMERFLEEFLEEIANG